MSIRLGKLAKQLGRSEEEVMAVALELGLRQHRPNDQLSSDGEARLRAALLKVRPGRGPMLRPEDLPAPPPRREAARDPDWDTWQQVALADDGALRRAEEERRRGAQANRPIQHARKPAPTREERYEDDGPDHGGAAAPRRAPLPPSTRAASDHSPEEALKHLGFAGLAARKDVAPLLPPDIGELLHRAHLSQAQLDAIEAAVKAHVARACGDPECEAGLKATGRPLILVSDRNRCDYCHGSNARRSLQALITACESHGIERLLVVGGSPNSHAELEAEIPRTIKLRLISGTDRLNARDAKAHLQWAQVCAIWAPTQLDHKVSNLFSGQRTGAGRKAIFVEHRSVELLARTVATHLDTQAAR